MRISSCSAPPASGVSPLLSTKRSGVVPAAGLATGAGKSSASPDRLESTATTSWWSRTVTVPVYLAVPEKWLARRCITGAL